MVKEVIASVCFSGTSSRLAPLFPGDVPGVGATCAVQHVLSAFLADLGCGHGA